MREAKKQSEEAIRVRLFASRTAQNRMPQFLLQAKQSKRMREIEQKEAQLAELREKHDEKVREAQKFEQELQDINV